MKIRTTYDNCPGLPTVWGSLVHGILFSIIAYIILAQKDAEATPQIKIEKIIDSTQEINISSNNE